MVDLPLRDSLPLGIGTASDTLLFVLQDQDRNIPNDPALPPSPIFPTAVQFSVLDIIFNLETEGGGLGDTLAFNGDSLV
jgi:hypothetical protein